jgi:chorismate lyase
MNRVRWHEARTWRHIGLSPAWAMWLLDQGSLTQRLQQASACSVRVRVLRQKWDYPQPEERQLLQLAPRQYARLREVYLGNDRHHWIFARTIIPELLLTGQHRYLRHWGEKPLGDILFAKPARIRQQLQIAQIPLSHPLLNTIKADFDTLLRHKNQFLWGRRSLFYLQEQPLLILEIFLPTLQDDICLC